MRHFRLLFLFIIGALLVPHSIMAATFTVGTCASPSYPTISAAVAAATAGSIVKVCPGTYPEQVVISTSLTLEGITSGNASRAVITVPGSGFPMTVTSTIPDFAGKTVTPQVLVTVPGVNISNITVDGTGASVSTNVFAGIMYESGSSGIVKGVSTRNQISTGSYGAGIWAENGNPSAESVTIENSSVHDMGDYGIILGSSQNPPSLTVTILKNDVASSFGGIGNNGANAIITSNLVTLVTGGSYGIVMDGYRSSTTGSITSNTVSNANIAAIYDSAQTSISIKSNLLWNSANVGIGINAVNATIELNTITKASVGIEFSCSKGPNTVKSNTISDVTTGLDQVPLSVVSANTYDNVDILRTSTCGFAPTTAPPSPLLRN